MILLDAGLWGMAGAAAVEVMDLYGAIKTNKVFPWHLEDEPALGVYLFCIVLRLALGTFAGVVCATTGPLGVAGAVAAGVAAPKLLEELDRYAPRVNIASVRAPQALPVATDANNSRSPSREPADLLEATPSDGGVTDED